MILWEMRGALQALIVIGLAIASWRRGAAPERATVTIVLAIVAATWLSRFLGLVGLPQPRAGGFSDTEVAYVLIDGCALVALFIIAIRANRIYPLWMTGFQITATAMHFVNELASDRAQVAYAILNILPLYFMIASQALGLWFHIRREKRLGPYRSWRPASNPSPATRPT